MAQTIEDLITDLVDDEKIPESVKIQMLKGWKDKLLDNNSNRIMGKEEAERHFKYLGKIDGIIVALMGEI